MNKAIKYTSNWWVSGSHMVAIFAGEHLLRSSQEFAFSWERWCKQWRIFSSWLWMPLFTTVLNRRRMLLLPSRGKYPYEGEDTSSHEQGEDPQSRRKAHSIVVGNPKSSNKKVQGTSKCTLQYQQSKFKGPYVSAHEDITLATTNEGSTM